MREGTLNEALGLMTMEESEAWIRAYEQAYLRQSEHDAEVARLQSAIAEHVTMRSEYLARAEAAEAENASLLEQLDSLQRLKDATYLDFIERGKQIEEAKAEHADCALYERGAKNRIETLEAALKAKDEALLEIRDKWIPALRRDAIEGDKTLCHAGGIAFLLAHVVPEHAFPSSEKTAFEAISQSECAECTNGIICADHKVSTFKRVAVESAPKPCSCGEPSPDRLVIHRTDGPCSLRSREDNP